MRSEGAISREALSEVAQRARPVALAREQVLPVLPPLETLLPGGLRRGTTVGVSSTSLALALLAGPVQVGSWLAAVGMSTLGIAAAAELGITLDHLVLVADPPNDSWATTVATLVDAFDVVLVHARRHTKHADARRLAARARERGSVLVVLGNDPPGAVSPGGAPAPRTRGWPEAPDMCLSIIRSEWTGLGDGHGHLRARKVTIEVDGRRGAARPRRVDLWLPAAGGGVAEVEPLAEVRPFTRRETA
jgi:hypothetical protein